MGDGLPGAAGSLTEQRLRAEAEQLKLALAEARTPTVWRSGRPRPLPQTNGLVERFFGALKCEHLYCGVINDGDARAAPTPAAKRRNLPSSRNLPNYLTQDISRSRQARA